MLNLHWLSGELPRRLELSWSLGCITASRLVSWQRDSSKSNVLAWVWQKLRDQSAQLIQRIIHVRTDVKTSMCITLLQKPWYQFSALCIIEKNLLWILALRLYDRLKVIRPWSAFLRGIMWIKECLVVILILHTAYTLYFALDLLYLKNCIYYMFISYIVNDLLHNFDRLLMI